jgi:hypothetical protein
MLSTGGDAGIGMGSGGEQSMAVPAPVGRELLWLLLMLDHLDGFCQFAT